MAEKQKNSRAEKAVSGSKKKSEAQNAGKNTTPAKKTSRVSTEYERALPVNAVVACVSIFLFILFLVISINPEGALLKVIQSVVLGLIGKCICWNVVGIPFGISCMRGSMNRRKNQQYA